MKSHYFECQCSTADHTLRFILDEENGDIYTEIHLRLEIWYKRIWKAVKYIFGHKSKYGCFDCTMLKPNEYDKLISLLNKSKSILIKDTNNECMFKCKKTN